MKKTGRLFGVVVLAALLVFVYTACNLGGDTGTIILSTDTVAIGNGNLAAVVNVEGTATGAVALNTQNLPDGVTATVSGAMITIEGFRPTTNVSAITGTYIVGVSRGGAAESISVIVNLTTTWVAQNAPIILTPDVVHINNGNLTATVNVTGAATGAVTLNTATLPAGVNATVSGTAITVTGVQPTTNAVITGSYPVVVTRDGYTQNIFVAVNLSNTNLNPNIAHYRVGNLNQFANAYTPVTITPRPGASPGAISVRVTSTGGHVLPQAGTYTVTFDVAATPGWNAATNLFAGTLVLSAGASGGVGTTPSADILAIFGITETQFNAIAGGAGYIGWIYDAPWATMSLNWNNRSRADFDAMLATVGNAGIGVTYDQLRGGVDYVAGGVSAFANFRVNIMFFTTAGHGIPANRLTVSILQQ
jgi:hypothetical protein